MGSGGPPKALRTLAGRPLVHHSVRALVEGGVDEVVVAIRPELGEHFAAALADLAERVRLRLVAGGRERQESVGLALEALGGSEATVVLVHDAARPLVPVEVVRRVVEAVRAGAPAVVPVVPVVDTVREVGEDRTRGLNRSRLRAVQTPQGFDHQVLRDAHEELRRSGGTVTDDAAACELLGHPVLTVDGSPRSLKITAESDLALAETLLGPPRPPLAALRTGTGLDVHALAPGRPMRIACLDFADEPAGPVGHSDGDVVAHAVCDALLAAAGLGDLGSNYGTSDPRWAGAPGREFLAETVRRVRAAGFEVVNVSVQLVGNRPRFAARRDEAEALMSRLVGAPVSVSATTTDGLGLTGRGEGLAALASALVQASR
ncbi:2-C-methyl-D-erythritol 2,4-cyclodiphosphate synthase [Auraticoccus sp. F435]|uniref:Multifunctional fusion protein n=1 Tax=Auraticoccus cholistanensis TaxID=2656650 RepID=A0A6A9UVC4_9ACTN|nr:2-C-methyl-D-erythritol 2,4-cyclodiphosphate synthase [Auraticoccus cholistanensis]